eukprot:2253614-Prymnesium_polylepis.1
MYCRSLFCSEVYEWSWNASAALYVPCCHSLADVFERTVDPLSSGRPTNESNPQKSHRVEDRCRTPPPVAAPRVPAKRETRAPAAAPAGDRRPWGAVPTRCGGARRTTASTISCSFVGSHLRRASVARCEVGPLCMFFTRWVIPLANPTTHRSNVLGPADVCACACAHASRASVCEPMRHVSPLESEKMCRRGRMRRRGAVPLSAETTSPAAPRPPPRPLTRPCRSSQ